MRSVGLVVALLIAGPVLADAPTKPPVRRKKHRQKRPAVVDVLPAESARPAVPPGAQLGPDRTIEAPQAPGPNTSPPREVVPASVLDKPRDARQKDIQPPYPTGYDPGRNMQPTQGFSPSSQSVVP